MVTLINLDQPKAFDRVDQFSGGCLVCGWIWASLLQLDSLSLCVPWSRGGSERRKIKAFHFVSIDSSKLSALVHAVHPCAGTVPAQVEDELGPTRPYINWCYCMLTFERVVN